ncbi:TIGR00282 family metallophosphoesterase [Maridesulfovibrio hydrothermalis]|uniref:Putative hydrolase involved in biofilm formation n=1 Tax=Maridesulfovibrio hydrothermalis AM13 = DSM 14728 TaxID=1121451 RepID=L0RCQ2_9BACT|nr:TIGR00282 family metallophosphoesterase [Maridesulfovibrio hydrothermalis]CCO23351.1 putative hydrolase involved in biofilm formation [Maridesulfovibrio hydrothermalis AM13 = DSM 14728]
MRILFLGDIVGRPGRKGVASKVKGLRKDLGLDLIIANAENASQGIGLSIKNARDLLGCGIDILTSGNHIWKFQNLYSYLNTSERIIRPANVSESAPGRGWTIFEVRDDLQVAVINLQGRTFMTAADCPFRGADKILQDIPAEVKVVLVDFHAEATSEKQCLGRYLDGRVSVMVGTHTHVQTNDARIFDEGTGYITDLGMCGPTESCLGLTPKPVIKRFVSGLPQKWKVAGGPVELQGVLIEINEESGKTTSIKTWNSGRITGC